MGSIFVYRNATLMDSTSGLPIVQYVYRNFMYIGRSNYPTDAYYDGVIDEFVIFNSSLT